MRAGRVSGRADIAYHLALTDLYARLAAAVEGRYMVMGGLVAVIVLEADVLAVAGFPARRLNRAVAGGVDRRAHRGCPIQACMHFGVTEDRMSTRPEAGTHDAVVHWLADEELLPAFSLLVSITHNPLLRRNQTVIFLHFPTHAQPPQPPLS